MSGEVLCQTQFSSGPFAGTGNVSPLFTAARVGTAFLTAAILTIGGTNVPLSPLTDQRVVIYEYELSNQINRRSISAAKGITFDWVEDESSKNARLSNMKKLTAIENLQDNWNGYGAKAFNQSVVDKVRKILNEILYQPEIFPIPSDTIQMEFRNSKGDYLELVIDTTSFVSVLTELYDGTQTEFYTFDDTTNINSVVQNFYE